MLYRYLWLEWNGLESLYSIKQKNEVPKAIGEYANDIYPQIPCLVQGKLSTGEGYGVRYWNVECQVWDDEECDDYMGTCENCWNEPKEE